MKLYFVGKILPRWVIVFLIAIPCCFVAVLAASIACFILGVCVLAYNCFIAALLIDYNKISTMMFNIWHGKYTSGDIKDAFSGLVKPCSRFLSNQRK